MQSNSVMTPLKRLFGLLKEEKNQVYAIYFYAVLNGLVTLSLPLGIQAILNFILGGRISTSWVILVVIVALGVAFGGFLQISQLQIMEKLQQRIFSKSGLSIAYRLPKVKTEIMHGQYAPEIVNRFFDTVNLQKGIGKILIDFSAALLQVIFGLLLLAIYHPSFILFGAVLFGILFLIFYFTGPRGMETALKESSYKYLTAYWLEEVARTLNSFKLVGSTRLPILRADKLIQRYVEFRAKHFSVLVFQYKVMIGFKILIVTSLLFAGSLLLINDQISIGQFVAAEVIIVLVINSVEKLILSLETVYDTLVAVEKLGQVMDLELEHHNPSEKVIVAAPEGLKYSMSNVVFQPQDVEEPILKNVSLSIEPGRKVVVTGKSGSGKSALMALFSGLYEEFEGTVAVNDLSLEYINLEKYRGMVGDFLELQEIFHGSIRENILVGRDFDLSHLEYIIDLVGLKDYLYKLPEGLEAMLQPGGRGLSKSLAQKILLARGFVGKPKALIMENVFLHVEKDVFSKIVDYLFNGNWTLLMVSNDDEILSRADEVLLMDSGNIIYHGSYEGYKNLTI
ncbi:peptidase domain-containing ABC transporter [Algoriphagus sp.]|jgi:ABC-type bacteriocin/lantibiotic exporter with double-glycine peptidase domain|uniref:peptidase domain-containing ABC transporter n=1 Tax=Algoriphagus sp. TaxID=1872435 RepID=UPI002727F0AF|nr:ATP-binding cassette domain-containing protein [Algoriphagus sp.]MDO8967642.1 ATP-binding cassette domain-containing protein [Algoriphagus sp.]MDP3202165.1 ATP-binding cassette domain-containing protein [Algoriphagus sp.]